MNLKRKTLTLKQRKFVNEYVKTGNGTQSALKVYDSKEPIVAGSIATENLKKPLIRESIEKALEDNGVTPSVILKQISSISAKQSDKYSGDTILKANIEILKLMGAYPGSKHSSLSISVKGNIKDLGFSEVKDELKVIDDELSKVMTEEPIAS